jgi:peptide/nickel transport system permease protein
VIAFFVLRRRRRPFSDFPKLVLSGTAPAPVPAVLAVTAVVCALAGVCAALAPYYHIFGTDKVGIDVFYQSLKSIRTGLMIGTLTTLVMLPFAIVLGVCAGYFRGWVDDVIQYFYTTLSSIPAVLLIASAALILEVYMSKNAESFTSLVARADLRLLALCVILGITSWTGLCRMLRGETLKLKEIDFVEASRAFGVGHATIILKHMVPNIMHIVMISIVLDFSGLVLAEAVLSYIDIGVDPSMESWGNMINSARLELAREPVVWWSLLAAFVFMFVLVLAANLFADAVRDAFDPRLRVII